MSDEIESKFAVCSHERKHCVTGFLAASFATWDFLQFIFMPEVKLWLVIKFVPSGRSKNALSILLFNYQWLCSTFRIDAQCSCSVLSHCSLDPSSETIFNDAYIIFLKNPYRIGSINVLIYMTPKINNGRWLCLKLQCYSVFATTAYSWPRSIRYMLTFVLKLISWDVLYRGAL